MIIPLQLLKNLSAATMMLSGQQPNRVLLQGASSVGRGVNGLAVTGAKVTSVKVKRRYSLMHTHILKCQKDKLFCYKIL